MIQLLDLKVQNAALQEEIEEAVLRVTRSGRYILGPEVEAFEQEWARYCGVTHCIGTGNAMEALQLILMASGITGEVIVPSNTYIATWLAVTHAGAHVVPVEPDPLTYNIDPAQIEAAITPRTEAILAVHLYGRPADMDAINAIGAKHGIKVFADAAQAHGATYKGRTAGSLCDAEAFSFYPSKNLGALGDGGAVTTNDEALADRIRRMRNYGGVGRVDHTVVGLNSRLDEMQAAILSAKLPHLANMNARRAQIALYYEWMLADVVRVPQHDPGAVWHQYVIRTPNRDRLQQRLREAGVDTHVHYPVPPHLEGAYADRNRWHFVIAEILGCEVLSLPIGYSFDVARVADAVRACA